MENNEKFLPVGTVVMLKGGKKRIMITGFCIENNVDNKKTLYDYCGCLYPEGFISLEENLLFNHDQIEKVYFKGYVDEEEKEFKKNLNKMLDNMII